MCVIVLSFVELVCGDGFFLHHLASQPRVDPLIPVLQAIKLLCLQYMFEIGPVSALIIMLLIFSKLEVVLHFSGWEKVAWV